MVVEMASLETYIDVSEIEDLRQEFEHMSASGLPRHLRDRLNRFLDREEEIVKVESTKDGLVARVTPEFSALAAAIRGFYVTRDHNA